MMLRVDPEAALPVYEQIRLQIQRMAVTGTLAAGTRLPTIRQLSADLGLAKGTVSKAYELLESDRVVEARGRNGTFIAQQAKVRPEKRTAQLAAAADAFVVTTRQLGLDEDAAHDALQQAWRSLSDG